MGHRLASWRAVCVHFVLPDVETRATQRVAFAALSLAAFLSERRKNALLGFTPSEADKKFLADFDRDKAKDLDARITAAKNKVRDLTGKVMIGLFADDGKELTCQVCGNDGVAFGVRSVEGGTRCCSLASSPATSVDFVSMMPMKCSNVDTRPCAK